VGNWVGADPDAIAHAAAGNERVFDTIDANGDGALSAAEFTEPAASTAAAPPAGSSCLRRRMTRQKQVILAEAVAVPPAPVALIVQLSPAVPTGSCVEPAQSTGPEPTKVPVHE